MLIAKFLPLSRATVIAKLLSTPPPSLSPSFLHRCIGSQRNPFKAMSTTSQHPKILSSVELNSSEAKWVTLKEISWQDQDGKQRRWEVAERKTRGSSGIDGVAILAILQPSKPDEPLSTVIIEQYRPPAANFCIELPAGLIDASETAETAAIRELEEETGLKGAKVIESSPILVSDPGMTTANMKLVTLTVPVDSIHSPLPEQKLEVGEHIVRRVVQLDNLNGVLKDYAEKGFAIDARLSHFAVGWEFASRFSAAAGKSISSPSL